MVQECLCKSPLRKDIRCANLIIFHYAYVYIVLMSGMWELTMDTPRGTITNTAKIAKMQKNLQNYDVFLHLMNMPCNPHAAGQCATHMCQKFCLVRNHL